MADVYESLARLNTYYSQQLIEAQCVAIACLALGANKAPLQTQFRKSIFSPLGEVGLDILGLSTVGSGNARPNIPILASEADVQEVLQCPQRLLQLSSEAAAGHGAFTGILAVRLIRYTTDDPAKQAENSHAFALPNVSRLPREIRRYAARKNGEVAYALDPGYRGNGFMSAHQLFEGLRYEVIANGNAIQHGLLAYVVKRR